MKRRPKEKQGIVPGADLLTAMTADATGWDQHRHRPLRAQGRPPGLQIRTNMNHSGT
jgi:hypothetical protein